MPRTAGPVVAPIVKVTVSRSVAVTFPTAVTFSSTTNVAEDVNTGAVESVTLTVLVAVPAFPEGSVAVYVSVYSPTVSYLNSDVLCCSVTRSISSCNCCCEVHCCTSFIT